MITDNKMRKMLKKVSLIAFILASLLISFKSHAGFREALSALQHKDAELMLVEVEKAVKAKNHDGLSLYISTLESRFYEFTYDSRLNEKVTSFLVESQRYKLLGYLKQVKGVGELNANDTLLNVLDILETDTVVKGNHKKRDNFQFLGVPTALYWGDVTDKKNYYKKTDDWLIELEKAAKFSEFHNLAYAKLLLGYPLSSVYPKDLDFKKLQTLESFKEQKIKNLRIVDKELGFEKLKDLVVNSENAYASCLMGDLYKQGNYVSKDNDEAYKWYKKAYLLGPDANLFGYHPRNNCGQEKLDELYKSGILKKIDQAFYKKVKGLGGVLPPARTLDLIQPPKLLNSLQYHNSTQPVLELMESKPNYKLQVFEGGEVRYSSTNFNGWQLLTGIKRTDVISRNAVVGADSWQLQPAVLDSLVKELTKLGVYEMPFEKTEGLLCDTGELAIHSIIKLRNNNYRKVVYFQGWANHRTSDKYPALSALLSTIEKHIPTQHLRCGEESLTKEYLACVAADKKIEETGNQWVADQKAKK
jgi:TPR repeat protein